tara:strand:+ start:708 stop:959 length:252 start_codon:yes stop_codon:yes gene_type:complete
MKFRGGPPRKFSRKQISRENFTESDPFIFCDLCLKPAEYGDIGVTGTAPSVTFQMTGLAARVSKERKAGKTRHDAEHNRDGVV